MAKPYEDRRRWGWPAARVAVCGLIAVSGATGSVTAREPAAALPATGREQLHAVLWMQAAAEYRALAEQVFRQAAMQLPALEAPGSAALEQWDTPGSALAALPTAIVMDVDETLLDNTYYQARLLRDGQDFSQASWTAWVVEASAPAIPGALDYARAAHARGHRLFYVTNRECPREPAPASEDSCPQRSATARNLAALGFPGATEPGAILVRNGAPGWRTSDKTSRRAAIARDHRIVALVGDDLRDFVERAAFDARRDELSGLFGVRWFLLPNPMYGSWERALSDPACREGDAPTACARQRLARKYTILDTAP
jgi:acid phosphatase